MQTVSLWNRQYNSFIEVKCFIKGNCFPAAGTVILCSQQNYYEYQKKNEIRVGNFKRRRAQGDAMTAWALFFIIAYWYVPTNYMAVFFSF